MTPSMRKGMPAMAVALCLGAGAAGAADDQAGKGAFWDKAFETLNLKTQAGPMPGFVEQSRPDPSRMNYIPTGRTHPARGVAVETPAQIEATKRALDAARDAQLKRAPELAKPAAAGTVAKKPMARPDKPTASN